MKTVFADVKLWVLGSFALPANGPLEQDERCNVSINCKDRRAFFNPVFTYKGPQRCSRVHTLESAVLTNRIFKKAGEEEGKQNRNREEEKKSFTGSYLPAPAHPPPSKSENWRFVAPLERGEGAKAEPRKSLLPIAGGSLNKIRFKWQEPNFCKPPRSIFWLRLKDEY